MRLVSQHKTLLTAVAATLALAAPGGAGAKQEDKKGYVAPANTLFMVFANPVEGQDAAFNSWYDKHISDLVRLPEYVRAQRFQMQPRKGRPDPAYKYVILYEIKGDPDAALAALGAAVKRGDVQAPDTRWVLKTEGMAYRPVTGIFK